MYVPREGRFVFRVRRRRCGIVPEGFSDRYTAISLIGLAEVPDDAARDVLHGTSLVDACRRLVERSLESKKLGDVALVQWAARRLDLNEEARRLTTRLVCLDPDGDDHPTVELAWALAAQSIETVSGADEPLARRLADRLLATYQPESQLFGHWPLAAKSVRSHVTCFADQVYPIQALSLYYRRTRNDRDFTVAIECASRICLLQGERGQWWWHYDVRTGNVVEGYPVYSVHQDAMAPMALFALQEAGGPDYSAQVMKGLNWLTDSPEIGGSLIDLGADLVWRKVGRREPGKLSRRVNAVASRVHSGWRVSAVNRWFPPNRIDFECRPYHLGWLLHAWRNYNEQNAQTGGFSVLDAVIPVA
jgi:hypothetical protein